MQEATEIAVNIRGIAFGGAGVGEVTAQADGQRDLLGITAFVPFTAPGEQVTARVVERKERYLHAQLLEVQVQAPTRVTPRCKLFTQCGGCELQHLSYQEQLVQKHEMIRGALRAAKVPSSVLERLSPVFPGDEYEYRRRVTLHLDSSGKIGFYRESSRAVVATTDCPISVPAINAALARAPDFGRAVRGKVTSVLLEADDQGVIAVLKSPYDLAQNDIQAIMQAARQFVPSALLFVGDREVSGFGRQILELPLNEAGNFTLRVPAGYFSQVNAGVNRNLVGKTLELAGTVFGKSVYDLYAGAGNFALPFARAGARVRAVEVDKRLVAFGRENASRYNLQRTLELVESSVERFLDPRAERDRLKAEPPDIIIADPPRSGLGNLVHNLPPAETLFLVSCHLPSFVRDVKLLSEGGWTLDSAHPFDMFAQTTYIEILSAFSRPPGGP